MNYKNGLWSGPKALETRRAYIRAYNRRHRAYKIAYNRAYRRDLPLPKVSDFPREGSSLPS